MKVTVVLATALALTPAWAFASVMAEFAAVDARQKACIDKNPSNIGMKTCTYDAYSQADQILNKVYRSVVAGLKTASPGEKVGDDEKEKLKRLIKAEQAWIAFRDAECDLQGVEMLGGTGEGLAVSGCLLELTKQRAKSLSDLFEAK